MGVFRFFNEVPPSGSRVFVPCIANMKFYNPFFILLKWEVKELTPFFLTMTLFFLTLTLPSLMMTPFFLTMTPFFLTIMPFFLTLMPFFLTSENRTRTTRTTRETTDKGLSYWLLSYLVIKGLGTYN
ncbi:MAG: hypothetical protein K9J16_02040 [Melioribacteraceae bacterium]|nr:hypothetical protein [Melioribacteraceae bacterium]MCF8353047.1 hypothetical protein [Melioribacteraceae bacterium]MCF8392938.1 hypothetical protein [Melioribacteraceae bacterium]MCF8417767.1 hypothetical protein [Melioribacteraceae bacterium]